MIIKEFQKSTASTAIKPVSYDDYRLVALGQPIVTSTINKKRIGWQVLVYWDGHVNCYLKIVETPETLSITDTDDGKILFGPHLLGHIKYADTYESVIQSLFRDAMDKLAFKLEPKDEIFGQRRWWTPGADAATSDTYTVTTRRWMRKFKGQY